MTGFPCHRPRSRAVLVLAAVIAALGVATLAPRPALAQGFSFFGNLFGGGQAQPPPPAYPGYAPRPDYYYYAPRRRARRHPIEQTQREAPRERPAPVPAAPPKPAATRFVYVFGDSLGQLLANGLDDALSDRPEVGVVHKGRGSSGLVLQDYYDWPRTIATLLAGKDKIDVAVMMIGSNDRQAIHEGGKTYDVGSDDWTAAYQKRVMAIDEAFRAKDVPLVWVGVPITKDSDFADDMAALNDIFREAAAKTGATYVDTWEAFSDDNGDFQTYGPDVNGQTVRLRTSDGIYFTRAGARKLAHFVEAHVRRDLDGKAPPPPPAAAGPVATIGGGAFVKPETKTKSDVGLVRDLNAAPVAVNGELVTPSTPASSIVADDKGAIEKMLAEERKPAPSGRADDLRWPPPAARPDP